MLIIGCSAIDHCMIRRAFVLQLNVAKGRRFQLVLIKPSHYDNDGYVIRWWRAITPSNSLAAVYGIAADCAERQVLGPMSPWIYRSSTRRTLA